MKVEWLKYTNVMYQNGRQRHQLMSACSDKNSEYYLLFVLPLKEIVFLSIFGRQKISGAHIIIYATFFTGLLESLT